MNGLIGPQPHPEVTHSSHGHQGPSHFWQRNILCSASKLSYICHMCSARTCPRPERPRQRPHLWRLGPHGTVMDSVRKQLHEGDSSGWKCAQRDLLEVILKGCGCAGSQSTTGAALGMGGGVGGGVAQLLVCLLF